MSVLWKERFSAGESPYVRLSAAPLCQILKDRIESWETLACLKETQSICGPLTRPRVCWRFKNMWWSHFVWDSGGGSGGKLDNFFLASEGMCRAWIWKRFCKRSFTSSGLNRLIWVEGGAGSGNWGGASRSSVWSQDILSSQPDSALCAFWKAAENICAQPNEAGLFQPSPCCHFQLPERSLTLSTSPTHLQMSLDLTGPMLIHGSFVCPSSPCFCDHSCI